MSRPDKKSAVRRPWIRWALLALFLLVLYQVMAGPRGLLKVADLRDQKKQILREIDSLETRRVELLAEQKRLLTDTTYLEKLARKELGMARPGEKVYRFVSPGRGADSAR
jgi:cell division protein FtsB